MTAYTAQAEIPTDSGEALPARFSLRAVLALALVIFGDWLFFGQPVGISFAIYLAALGFALAVAESPASRLLTIAFTCLIISALPLAEHVNLLSILIACTGTAIFAVVMAGGGTSLRTAAGSVAGLVIAGPFQVIPDYTRAFREGRLRLGNLTAWLLPALFGAAFLTLFAVANPLIANWLDRLQPGQLFDADTFLHFVFWFILLSFSWPILAPRLRRWFAGRDEPVPVESSVAAARKFFSPLAVLGSLVLFNLMFAVQTGMDIAYLWGGAALPEGLTYADYAQRGAYPLIATALLAAAFVLIALPDGRQKPESAIYSLVLIWIAQNIVLVISAMLRLDLYVEVYSLTLLRVAAFIWMGLVAAGLVLILTRIAFKKSNGWLVTANLMVLAATLYVCAWINFPALVANYNVTQQQNAQNGALTVDLNYLFSLGSGAIPALDRLEQSCIIQHSSRPARTETVCAAALSDQLVRKHAERMQNWRAWTFRGWRLQEYLNARDRAAGRRSGRTKPGLTGIAVATARAAPCSKSLTDFKDLHNSPI